MRIAVIGGPMCGKSTYASDLRNQGYAHYCGDPLSKVKRISTGAIYLPEHLDWSQGSEYIAFNWFSMRGPWIVEGVAVVRALRKWLQFSKEMPCDKIVYFTDKHPSVDRLPGQEAMDKAVSTMWDEISNNYSHITEFISWKNDVPKNITPQTQKRASFNFFKG